MGCLVVLWRRCGRECTGTLDFPALQARLDQVGCRKRNIVCWPVVLVSPFADRGLDFRAGKSCECIGSVGSCYEARFAEIVLCLEISDLGLVRTIDDANRDGEDSVALGFLTNGLVNDIVVLDNLFLDGIPQILKTSFPLLKIDVAKTAVEKHLARVELEEQTELGVIDHCVSAEVEQCVVEVCERLLEIAQEEI